MLITQQCEFEKSVTWSYIDKWQVEKTKINNVIKFNLEKDNLVGVLRMVTCLNLLSNVQHQACYC